jgi:SAM-dependent methyltransferase
MNVDNRAIYDAHWQSWLDMKVYGPASRWLRSLLRDQIRGLPNPENVKSILDVGCGEGTITHCLAQWLPHAQVTGVDFSETGIQCASDRYREKNLRFFHDPASDELNKRHDLVSAFEVLEHVEDWQPLLSRMAASARQFLLLSFPTGRMRSFEVHVGHYRNFKKGEVEEFLSSQGFRPHRLLYAGFPFYSPLYRELCNLTDSASNRFSTGIYDWRQKLVAGLFYGLFRFASSKHRLGDQFCGLFCRAAVR